MLAFEYLDATNLASPAHSHLVKLDLGLGALDAGRVTRREVYVEAGKDDVSELTFRRAAR